MLIDVKNVTKVFKSGEVETAALKGVSFSVEKGEFVAIIGPSGSGKSTLMHIVSCLDNSTSGQYFLEGKDVSKFSEDKLAEIRKNKIGFVFQKFNLLPRTTVLRNVMLPLIYAGVPNKEREEMAKSVLKASAFPEKFWNHLSNQLSGGMTQRVAIARALVNNPLLILADEPTGNLDSKTGEAVLETFEKLNREGRTIILVTHEKYIARRAKRIITLEDGKILEDTANHRSKIVKEIKE
ncbi:MAG: ABC transporter ATP-binding protein [Candidatus Moranbacteria bacterium]|nr:ABC transporter ATP-binding protein [Candidatus Moranbacteria bacterium]